MWFGSPVPEGWRGSDVRRGVGGYEREAEQRGSGAARGVHAGCRAAREDVPVDRDRGPHAVERAGRAWRVTAATVDRGGPRGSGNGRRCGADLLDERSFASRSTRDRGCPVPESPGADQKEHQGQRASPGVGPAHHRHPASRDFALLSAKLPQFSDGILGGEGRMGARSWRRLLGLPDSGSPSHPGASPGPRSARQHHGSGPGAHRCTRGSHRCGPQVRLHRPGCCAGGAPARVPPQRRRRATWPRITRFAPRLYPPHGKPARRGGPLSSDGRGALSDFPVGFSSQNGFRSGRLRDPPTDPTVDLGFVDCRRLVSGFHVRYAAPHACGPPWLLPCRPSAALRRDRRLAESARAR